SRATELGPGDRGVRCSGCRKRFSAAIANREGQPPSAHRSPIAWPVEPIASVLGGSVRASGRNTVSSRQISIWSARHGALQERLMPPKWLEQARYGGD